MTHQAGTANNPMDLLQKLAVFIGANGWTVDSSVADGAGWRLHAHRSGVYVNLRAFVSESYTLMFDNTYSGGGLFSGIELYCGDGYSAGASWKNQSGGPKQVSFPTANTGAAAPLPAGAISGYHFFANNSNDSVVVVVEKSTGVFTNFGWGVSLSKVGTYTGGAYFFAPCGRYYAGYNIEQLFQGRAVSAMPPMSYEDDGIGNACASFVRADIDTFTGKWLGVGGSLTQDNNSTGKAAYSTAVFRSYPQSGAPSLFPIKSTNALSGQSILQPVHILGRRDSGGVSFLGSVPGIFTTNACAKGFAASGVYVWGTSEYMVFPGPTSGQNLPLYGPTMAYGFAVRMN